jgi:hypothetical protein
MATIHELEALADKCGVAKLKAEMSMIHLKAVEDSVKMKEGTFACDGCEIAHQSTCCGATVIFDSTCSICYNHCKETCEKCDFNHQ